MNHEVFNQPPALHDYNLFTTDRALRESVAREGADWACAQTAEFGRIIGTAEAITWGVLANEHPPVLHTHDRYGRRRDEVEFHPAWHKLMRLSVEYGIHNLAWVDARARSARRSSSFGHARLTKRSWVYVSDLDDLFCGTRAPPESSPRA